MYNRQALPPYRPDNRHTIESAPLLSKTNALTLYSAHSASAVPAACPCLRFSLTAWYLHQTPEYKILRRISTFSRMGSRSNSLQHSDIIIISMVLHSSSKSILSYFCFRGFGVPFLISCSISS